MKSSPDYLHGFNDAEQLRLYQQARFLEQMVFSHIDLSGVSHLLEVGVGVGAQSEIILRRFPQLQLTGIDRSEKQIRQAETFLQKIPYAKDRFRLLQMDAADIDLPSAPDFDGAFLCWILEHVPDPVKVLSEVRRVLKPGSLVVISEVLNSTFFVEPYSPNVLQYWMKFNDLQYDMGGDPFIGAKLGNILQSLGYAHIETRPRNMHLDNRNPAKRADMIQYWTELLLSGLPQLLEAGYVTEEIGDAVREEMKKVAKDPNAVFYYSFMQAMAYTS